MREKLFAIGDDFWIETEGGERAFKVDGKALRVRDTFILKDSGGEDLFKAQAKKLHIHDTMKIEAGGDTVATIQKATSSITSTRSSAMAIRSPRSPSDGSACARHTESRSLPVRTTR
jgi:uncharacterized protein YxjI